jgi:hypothetical protein
MESFNYIPRYASRPIPPRKVHIHRKSSELNEELNDRSSREPISSERSVLEFLEKIAQVQEDASTDIAIAADTPRIELLGSSRTRFIRIEQIWNRVRIRIRRGHFLLCLEKAAKSPSILDERFLRDLSPPPPLHDVIVDLEN